MCVLCVLVLLSAAGQDAGLYLIQDKMAMQGRTPTDTDLAALKQLPGLQLKNAFKRFTSAKTVRFQNGYYGFGYTEHAGGWDTFSRYIRTFLNQIKELEDKDTSGSQRQETGNLLDTGNDHTGGLWKQVSRRRGSLSPLFAPLVTLTSCLLSVTDRSSYGVSGLLLATGGACNGSEDRYESSNLRDVVGGNVSHRERYCRRGSHLFPAAVCIRVVVR